MSKHNGAARDSYHGLRTSGLLTVGQVAELVGCSPRSVQVWVDRGILPGHRVPGLSGCRRVRRVDLFAFARARGMAGVLEALPWRSHLCGLPSGLASAVREAGQARSCPVEVHAGPSSLLLSIREGETGAVVLSGDLGRSLVAEMVQALRSLRPALTAVGVHGVPDDWPGVPVGAVAVGPAAGDVVGFLWS